VVGWEDMSSRVSNPRGVDGTRHVQPHVTVGIDLGSQPGRTAVCQIDWGGPKGVVLPTAADTLDDEQLLRLMCADEVSKVGIDAPFGWPAAFIDALVTYQATVRWLPLDSSELRFRATEFRVKDRTGLQPLSAMTDRLIWPTMRCATLLSQLPGPPIDRSGADRVVEVYPAAALRRWLGRDSASPQVSSYKGSGPAQCEKREEIVSALAHQTAAALDLSADFRQRCVDNDDVLDSLVCVLIARSAEKGAVDAIPPGSRWAAAREGWITLPASDSLSALM
jgi:Protein of unknown function (DUF429)